MERRIVTQEKKWEKEKTTQFTLLKIIGLIGLFVAVIGGIGAVVFLFALTDSASHESSSDSSSDSETLLTFVPTANPNLSPTTLQPTSKPTLTPTLLPTQNPTKAPFAPLNTIDENVLETICTNTQNELENFGEDVVARDEVFGVCLDDDVFGICFLDGFLGAFFGTLSCQDITSFDTVCNCPTGDIIDLRRLTTGIDSPDDICADLDILLFPQCSLLDNGVDINLRNLV